MSGQLQRQKELYDKIVHGEPFELLSIGESQLELHLPWTGPFSVMKKLSDVTYRIQDLLNKRRKLVVHFDRLKPYLSSPIETALQDL